MNINGQRNLVGSLVWAAAILALAFAGNWARAAGLLGPETPARITTAVIGLFVVWHGNRLPKTFVPSACARQATRFAGWTMTISGLIYAALYIFAPMHVAFVWGCGAIAAGILITLAYCFSLRARRHFA